MYPCLLFRLSFKRMQRTLWNGLLLMLECKLKKNKVKSTQLGIVKPNLAETAATLGLGSDHPILYMSKTSNTKKWQNSIRCADKSQKLKNKKMLRNSRKFKR